MHPSIAAAVGLTLVACATPEQMSHAECQKMGIEPGTSGFRQCQVAVAQRNEAQAKAAAMAVAAGMKAQSDAYYRAAQQPVYMPPRPVTCQNLGGNPPMIRCY